MSSRASRQLQLQPKPDYFDLDTPPSYNTRSRTNSFVGQRQQKAQIVHLPPLLLEAELKKQRREPTKATKGTKQFAPGYVRPIDPDRFKAEIELNKKIVEALSPLKRLAEHNKRHIRKPPARRKFSLIRGLPTAPPKRSSGVPNNAQSYVPSATYAKTLKKL